MLAGLVLILGWVTAWSIRGGLFGEARTEGKVLHAAQGVEPEQREDSRALVGSIAAEDSRTLTDFSAAEEPAGRDVVRVLFSVRGRVLGHKRGQPFSKPLPIDVMLMRTGRERSALSGRSNSLGHYEFEGVEPGRYTLHAGDSGSNSDRILGAFGSTSVDVRGDVEVRDLIIQLPPSAPKSAEELYPDSTTVRVFPMLDGELVRGLKVIVIDENTQLRRAVFSHQTDEYIAALLSASDSPQRLHLEDGEGNVLGATATARHYPVGQVSDVVIEVTAGALEVHLPGTFIIGEDMRLQVLLDGPASLFGDAPYASIQRRAEARSGAGTPCDAFFPKLLAGTYHVSTNLLLRSEGLGWRSIGQGPAGQVTVVVGETAKLIL